MNEPQETPGRNHPEEVAPPPKRPESLKARQASDLYRELRRRSVTPKPKAAKPPLSKSAGARRRRPARAAARGRPRSERQDLAQAVRLMAVETAGRFDPQLNDSLGFLPQCRRGAARHAVTIACRHRGLGGAHGIWQSRSHPANPWPPPVLGPATRYKGREIIDEKKRRNTRDR